jgi:hypothetical protein
MGRRVAGDRAPPLGPGSEPSVQFSPVKVCNFIPVLTPGTDSQPLLVIIGTTPSEASGSAPHEPKRALRATLVSPMMYTYKGRCCPAAHPTRWAIAVLESPSSSTFRSTRVSHPYTALPRNWRSGESGARHTGAYQPLPQSVQRLALSCRWLRWSGMQRVNRQRTPATQQVIPTPTLSLTVQRLRFGE